MAFFFPLSQKVAIFFQDTSNIAWEEGIEILVKSRTAKERFFFCEMRKWWPYINQVVLLFPFTFRLFFGTRWWQQQLVSKCSDWHQEKKWRRRRMISITAAPLLQNRRPLTYLSACSSSSRSSTVVEFSPPFWGALLSAPFPPEKQVLAFRRRVFPPPPSVLPSVTSRHTAYNKIARCDGGGGDDGCGCGCGCLRLRRLRPQLGTLVIWLTLPPPLSRGGGGVEGNVEKC